MKLLGTVPAETMKSSSIHFYPRDILYSRLRPYLNKVILVDFEGLCSAEFITLIVETGIEPKFLQYRINSSDFVTFASHLDEGDRPRVNFSQISDFCILVPPSNEQRRIVEAIESYLSRLDEAVQSLERVQRNLKRYRASVLKAAVEGRLVPTEAELARREGRDYEPASDLLKRILAERKKRWVEDTAEKARAAAEAKARQAGKPWTDAINQTTLEAERTKALKKYQAPTPPDTTDLPDLPEGWCWAPFSQFSEQRLGKMLDQAKNRGELRKYLRNANLRWFGFDLSDLSEMRITDAEYDDVALKCGDIAVCEGGEPGRCAVWQHHDQSIAIQKAIHRVRVFQGLDPWFVCFALASASHTKRLSKAFTGTTIMHLTGESLRDFSIPIPPTVEQLRIVAETQKQLADLESIEALTMRQMKRCQRLRQSILKWAFEGKLVDQDPNDEPASVLLERIKAARAQSTTDKATTKKPRTPRKKTS